MRSGPFVKKLLKAREEKKLTPSIMLYPKVKSNIENTIKVNEGNISMRGFLVFIWVITAANIRIPRDTLPNLKIKGLEL